MNQVFGYLDLGWWIIPIRKGGKEPLTEKGFYDSSNEHSQIEKWIDGYGKDINFAVQTGEKSGLVIIDVDVSNGKEGDVELKNLIDKYGPLPKTVVSRTATGGFHLYFKYDPVRKPRKTKLGKHIDFLADSGYALVPPSKRENGVYSWTDGRSPFDFEIAELPEWVYTLTQRNVAEVVLNDDGKIPIGARHLYLFSLGGSLRRKGETYEVIRDALLSAYEHRCEKLPTDKEPESIERMSRDLCRYEPEDPFLSDKDAEISTKQKAIDSELQIVGFCLGATKDVAEVFSKLEAYYFLDGEASVVYRICKRLWAKGVSCNRKNVEIELQKKSKDIDLSRFTDVCVTRNLRDAEYHIENVSDSYKNREITSIYKDSADTASRGLAKPKDIITETNGRTLGLINDSNENNVFDTEGQVKLVRDLYEAALRGEQNLNEPTGIATYDEQTLGFPKSELTFIAGRPGQGKCVRYDTPIINPGNGEILTLQEAYDIGKRTGEFPVLSISKKGDQVPSKAIAFYDSGVQEGYRIKTRTGREIIGSKIHPFLTGGGWKKIEELEVGTKIATAREIPVFGELEVPDEEIKIMAYLIGDGYIGGGISFSSKNNLIVEDFRIAASKMGCKITPGAAEKYTHNYSVTRDKGERCNRILDVVREYELYGKVSREKFVPKKYFQLTKPKLSLFLNRLFSTDGSVSLVERSPHLSYSTTSKQLAKDIQHLLLRFGVISTIHTKHTTYNNEPYVFYTFRISGEDAIKFRNEIGMFRDRDKLDELVSMIEARNSSYYSDTLPNEVWSVVDRERIRRGLTWKDIHNARGRKGKGKFHRSRKRDGQRWFVREIADVLDSDELRMWLDANIYWDEIVSIEKDGPTQMYDLVVPETENFLAADIYAHNTAALLQINRNMNFRWKREGIRGCSVVFSAEMSAAQCAMRNASAIGKIDSIALRKGLVDRERVDNALQIYRENINTFIDQTPSPTGDYMITKTLAINTICPVKVVFFDFIALSGEEESNEVLRLFAAAKKLKALAKLLNIPVVVLSQLNRGIEERRPPIPKESDLSWSDNLTQLANQILFVVYPYKFHKNGIIWNINEPNKEPHPNRLLLFLSKNRDGASDILKMLFFPEYGLILDPKDVSMCNEIGIDGRLFGDID